MMKNVFITGLTILVFVFTFSCTPCSDESNHNKKENIEKKVVHSGEEGKLVLNNGKPWKTQAEMTNRVNNMISLLHSFSDNNTTDAYHKLSKDLNQEFDMIFKECTMTGEAHNQLHNFLIPIKDMLKMLQSSNIEECKQAYEHLKIHLSEYNTYFQ
ncbi:MAG: hypothetical protein L3J74_16370 [Bacteroidales bacterium]|nr:hypothetical protein [Bacteroidales bacterium]